MGKRYVLYWSCEPDSFSFILGQEKSLVICSVVSTDLHRDPLSVHNFMCTVPLIADAHDVLVSASL